MDQQAQPHQPQSKKPVKLSPVESLQTSKSKYKVKGFWTINGLVWPGHFSGVTKLVSGFDISDMYLETLEGWVVFRHKGALGATNGVATVELFEE